MLKVEFCIVNTLLLTGFTLAHNIMGALDTSAAVLTVLYIDQSQYNASLVRDRWQSEQIKLHLKTNHETSLKGTGHQILCLKSNVCMVCKHMYGTCMMVVI